MSHYYLGNGIFSTISNKTRLRDEDMLRAIRQYRSFSSSFPNVKSNSAFEKMSDKLSDYESITTKWKKLKVEPISRDYITVRAVFLFETKDKEGFQ